MVSHRKNCQQGQDRYHLSTNTGRSKGLHIQIAQPSNPPTSGGTRFIRRLSERPGGSKHGIKRHGQRAHTGRSTEVFGPSLPRGNDLPDSQRDHSPNSRPRMGPRMDGTTPRTGNTNNIGEKYNKDMQKMDELWKSTHNRSRKCHHCSRTVGSNTNMRSPSYPSTNTCPLQNLLIEMLDRSGLGKIAYLFDRIHTLSELSNLFGSAEQSNFFDSGPRTEVQDPNLPISPDQKTRLWMLVNSLHSSFPQYKVARTQEMNTEPTPIRDTGQMELGSLWQRTVSRHRPVEQWTTTDVAKLLHRLDQDQTSLLALQNNIDGQVLTTLLYTFDKQAHHNSKLCHPTESGGLGLSIQAVNWIQEDVQGFTRTNGFVHYSASAPRSRRLEAHRTVQIQIHRTSGVQES
jgi:hypothetical protein